MALYLVSIIGGDALIILVNLLVNLKTHTLSNFYIVVAGLLAGVAVIALDAISATLIRRALPEKWFSYKVKFHKVGNAECHFYEKLGIKSWKDNVLELGMFTAFSKKHVSNPNSREYLERFILESNYGALIHIVGVFLPLVLLAIPPFVANVPFFTSWRFSVPAIVVNAVLNFLPFMILRYNLPRLERMRIIAEKREAREKVA